MGTRTTDDGKLYKPAVGENGYGAVTNTNFDRLGRQTTQIKLVSHDDPIYIDSGVFVIVTLGMFASNAKWSIGASDKYDFPEVGGLNNSFEEESAPERAGCYYHNISLDDLHLDFAKIGAYFAAWNTKPKVLFAVWEQDPETSDWVIVATTLIEVEGSPL